MTIVPPAVAAWVALCLGLTAGHAVAGDGPSFLCRSALATIRVDFPGARAGDCAINAQDSFTLTISPEHAPPINPSPWYAFRLERMGKRPVAIELRYLHGKHRYVPKLSADGERWQPMDPGKIEAGADDGGNFARFNVPAGITWIAAQELSSSSERLHWLDELATSQDLQALTIGASHDGRAIRLVDTGAGPGRSQTLLILGGQHPPEVSGAMALQAFVEMLFASTAQARRFRARTRIVIAPVLNPDGIERGHWRSNRGGADLNRDWGAFSQPETRALRDWLDAQAEFVPTLTIDFHSTQRNLFYVQSEHEPVRYGDLVQRWLANGRARAPDYAFEVIGANENPGAGTSKNYFYQRHDTPAVTYEVGDETDRKLTQRGAQALASALMWVWP